MDWIRLDWDVALLDSGLPRGIYGANAGFGSSFVGERMGVTWLLNTDRAGPPRRLPPGVSRGKPVGYVWRSGWVARGMGGIWWARGANPWEERAGHEARTQDGRTPFCDELGFNGQRTGEGAVRRASRVGTRPRARGGGISPHHSPVGEGRVFFYGTEVRAVLKRGK